ncbi:MAG: hypothetical protein AMJ59_27765 [Gammaproteobacteria bacterium SG8_31]|nr:MAG: hypothetical protein AMJ59_27765 [Gammaproteobacteria bacterium SG8_31]
MESVEAVLIPVVAIIVIFGGAYGCIYFWLKTRNQQRLELLAKGLDRLRRWGAMLIGIGSGLLAGYGVSSGLGVDAWVAYIACISLASGLAVFSALRREKREESA